MILSGNSSIGPVYRINGSMGVEAAGCAGPLRNHRLIEIRLSGIEPPPRLLSTEKQSTASAVELAGNAIDKHSDRKASTMSVSIESAS
jgi:hypothetical protein